MNHRKVSKKCCATAIAAGSLFATGIVGSSTSEAAAVMAGNFRFLGTGAQVRSSLIEMNRQQRAHFDSFYAADANSSAKENTEGKCGEGRCGDSESSSSSSAESKTPEGKCGEGRCGE